MGFFIWLIWTSFCWWIKSCLFYQTNILKQFVEWLSLTWQFASITSWVLRFLNIDISQESVATCLTHGGILKYDFNRNLLLSLTVKEFWKSVNIWRSYEQEYCVFFLTHSVVFYPTLYNYPSTDVVLHHNTVNNLSAKSCEGAKQLKNTTMWIFSRILETAQSAGFCTLIL